MKTAELDFILPGELLARRPRELNGEKRSDSRMLVISRESDEIHNSYVKNIRDYLQKGDLLVFNNSKTINAKFRGRSSKGRIIEITLGTEFKEKNWYAKIVNFDESSLGVEYIVGEDFSFIVHKKSEYVKSYFEIELKYTSDLSYISEKYGSPIISDYVEKSWDLSYYQNDYSNIPGSVELPAAGRHFTQELKDDLIASGINIAYITLHTGLSSIDIQTDDIEHHKMHFERCSIDYTNAEIINNAKKRGSRIIAIGTTVTRTLESLASDDGLVEAKELLTDLYIYQGYKFKIVDGLVTNFHGPRSSRIALVSAFSSIEKVQEAYKLAIKSKYAFYEFGDATLIV